MTAWFAAAIVAVVLGVLLIASRVLAKVGALLLVAGLVVVAALVAVASAQQARATQVAATAAAVASGGQTMATVAIVFLVVVVLALAGLTGYLYLRLRRAESRPRWAPGPNALWRRIGEEPPAAFGGGDLAQALQNLILLETLRTLRDLRQPSALPAQEERPHPQGQRAEVENVLALFDEDADWWR